jgi:LPS export ABC transporter permease LptG
MQAYALCIAAFISIWLIFDISDHISRFLDFNMSFGVVLQYYLTQLPQILIILLPVSLLLALLFSLGRMSRTNEIVSMLTAGVSIPRVLMPLIGAGVVTTIFAGVLNYSLAPHAEQAQKMYFDRARASGIVGQLFRNRRDNRTWFIQQFRPSENQFTTVQVLQQDANDNIISNHLAASASYDEAARAWDLKGVKVVNYDATGNITSEENAESMRITDWSETPFRLASTNMRAEFLSFQELRDYLHFNSDFPRNLLAPFVTHLHYRIALPWTCLIVVFIAAPLAIGFTRGGVLSNVAAAIGLVFANNFLMHFFLALGEGNRIPPVLAAWTPNVLFAIIGGLLLWVRSTNRDLKSLNPFAARAVAAS